MAVSYAPVTPLGAFPAVRMRRNRRYDWLRCLVAENSLSVNDLVQPLFVATPDQCGPIASMPGVTRRCGQALIDYVGHLAELKVPAVALFPYYAPEDRCDDVATLLHAENLLCQAIVQIKKHMPQMGIITDVALDSYTCHGQDGIVRQGQIINDETNALIADYAVVQAALGVDLIAPSEMMDGRVGVIRHALDAAGFSQVGIMSYGVKYASSFYGPFRDAVGSASCLGQADKKTYQMDPANLNEALREVHLDLQEGADIIMIKPGLPYLDVVHVVKQTFKVPTFAYHVSGEYAMLKAAAEKGWLDYDSCLLESCLSFKRAGADAIFTYASAEIAQLLARG